MLPPRAVHHHQHGPVGHAEYRQVGAALAAFPTSLCSGASRCRPGPLGDENEFTGEPRLLPDGRSAYVRTLTWRSPRPPPAWAVGMPPTPPSPPSHTFHPHPALPRPAAPASPRCRATSFTSALLNCAAASSGVTGPRDSTAPTAASWSTALAGQGSAAATFPSAAAGRSSLSAASGKSCPKRGIW
jgi:hypothetical protein